ncbi:hypothetical protein B0G80_3785 [Paraburkholderia sp. BL6669N2]|uniref:hypothetical protein n=1 Tax=Paraburkholderia sp. BL6669N2 TaxID=1938807 RepID=UPI000E26B7ED|nr:hypothetical protein [Paraburkholderia sp. BL6669N2]REG60960.1 hypothetical protein B0G80_3785 [Paraburkholderia sp. BL6669N2]
MNDKTIAVERRPRLHDLTPVFVPFVVERAREATVAFRSESAGRSDEQIVNQCAFIASEQSRRQSYEQRIWLAERYGGEGIVNNGGGARCGLAGNLQVKGVGPNLLLGSGSDDAHSNGRLSRGDAIYEALWGEILNEALPYGGEKVIAVLRPFSAGPPRASDRALLVREPNVRPAHFERAIHFKPLHDVAWHREADVERVASLAPRLAAYLPKPEKCPEDEWQNLPDEQRFHYGLGELARRSAVQLAFGRSHLMSHGCTSSNISIEGKLLDFTSVMTLHASTQDTAQDLKSTWKRVWSEHIPLLRSLASICYYANRYWLRDGTRADRALEYSVRVFDQEFDLRCTQYFLCLAGIPGFVARQIAGHPSALQWVKLLISALDSWISSFSDVAPDDSRATRSEHSLEGRLAWISFARFAGLAGNESDACFPLFKVRDEMSEAYRLVMILALQEAEKVDVSRASFQRALLIGEARRLTAGAYLDREVVKAEIAEMLQTPSMHTGLKAPIDNFIRERKQTALLSMKYDDGLNMTLWNAPNRRVELDLRTDTLNISSFNEVSSHPVAQLEMLSRCNSEMKGMVARYGADRLARIASPGC